MMNDNAKIIAEELASLKTDIIKAYNESGKRTSGEFEQGLEITNTDSSGTLSGYLYLGGRNAGKQPPIEPILRWIEAKGITPIESKMKTSSLAYLIARKIAREGTNKENHLFIYDLVITPERIDKIFERLSEVNVNVFINEVTIMIEKLVNNR